MNGLIQGGNLFTLKEKERNEGRMKERREWKEKEEKKHLYPH